MNYVTLRHNRAGAVFRGCSALSTLARPDFARLSEARPQYCWLAAGPCLVILMTASLFRDMRSHNSHSKGGQYGDSF